VIRGTGIVSWDNCQLEPNWFVAANCCRLRCLATVDICTASLAYVLSIHGHCWLMSLDTPLMCFRDILNTAMLPPVTQYTDVSKAFFTF
jgi:hypothetical protein